MKERREEKGGEKTERAFGGLAGAVVAAAGLAGEVLEVEGDLEVSAVAQVEAEVPQEVGKKER